MTPDYAPELVRLQTELAEARAETALWKFRATENGKSVKRYKKLYNDLQAQEPTFNESK